MSAVRNTGLPQSLPRSPNDTGLTYARKYHLGLVKSGSRSSAPSFEFEVTQNRRINPRLPLQFPLRLQWVGGQQQRISTPLVTLNISSTGVFFLAPVQVEPGAAIELEIGLTDRPNGRERVRMRTKAHVVRATPDSQPGWHGLALTFDEIRFERDEQEAQNLASA